MHCYECDRAGHAVMAIAICQRCGGGACRKHVAALMHPGTPGGLVGFSQPRQEHVCVRCLAGFSEQPSLPRSGQDTRKRELPDGQTAVQIAEALLQQKPTSRQSTRRQRWLLVRSWLNRLFLTSPAGIREEQPYQPPPVGSSQEG